MAATLTELLADFGPDAKAAVWAHNLHVYTQAGWLGGYLREQFADRYYPLGFAFKEGQFQSIGSDGSGLHPWTVKPSPAGYVDWYMGCALPGPALLNFRDRAAAPRAAATWLDTTAPFRMAGSMWDPAWEQDEAKANKVRPLDWDGLIYVPVATPSTIIKFW